MVNYERFFGSTTGLSASPASLLIMVVICFIAETPSMAAPDSLESQPKPYLDDSFGGSLAGVRLVMR